MLNETSSKSKPFLLGHCILLGHCKSVNEKGTQYLDTTYVDRSFTGCIHLLENEVEIEDKWFTPSLRRSLIQHYNVCYGLKQVEW